MSRVSKNIFEKNLYSISGFKNIPDEWQAFLVQDIFEIGRGRVINQIEIDTHPGHYPVYSSQSFDDGIMGRIDTYDFDGDYLTWTTDGAYAGTVFHRRGKFNCTNVCGTLKADYNKVSLQFFLYHLGNISKRYVSYVGNPKLMNDVMANVAITVPPLPEQRRIAHILSTIDSVIEKTQSAIDKYKAIKQGMLHDLFTRGIDIKTGKLRPRYEAAPELYKKSKLGWIPNEWEVEIFGEQIYLVHGHQFRDYDFTEFGVPVVKIGQVKPENIDLSNCSYILTNRMEEFKNETIRNGDVLMALTGATLGKACFVSGLSNPVLQNYRVGRFEPIIAKNDIDKVFLYYILIAGELLVQIFTKVNSGAQGNIGKADFEKAIFKKPPFDEQKFIAQRLISIDKKLKSEESYLNKLQMLKSGLMNDLLTGKKRVKVDTEDLTKTA